MEMVSSQAKSCPIVTYSLRFKIEFTFGHKLRYEIKVLRLVKFPSNFAKQIGMLPAM